MIVDWHAHYIPLDTARQVAGVPLAFERRPDGAYGFVAGGATRVFGPGLFDLERQRAALRDAGLERRALSVPPFCLQYELPPEAGRRWARALNDGLAAAARAHPDRFVGLATLPLQDPPAALDELERAVGDLGLVGAEIATNINGVELDDPALEPFWARAAALRLPVLIHPHYIVGAGRMGGYYLVNLVGNPVETALAGARLLFGGVLERHPDLRVILAHGGGALPYLLGRLDHGDRVRPETRARAAAPLDGLRRLYYDSIVFDARALRYLVETVGAAQVVLGTDYPFDMGEEAPTAFVEGAGLAPDDARTILHDGDRLLPPA